jgi:hypothetical protein
VKGMEVTGSDGGSGGGGSSPAPTGLPGGRQ